MLPRKTSMAMPSSLSLTTNCSITSSSDWRVPGLNLRIVRSGDTLIALFTGCLFGIGLPMGCGGLGSGPPTSLEADGT